MSERNRGARETEELKRKRSERDKGARETEEQERETKK